VAGGAGLFPAADRRVRRDGGRPPTGYRRDSRPARAGRADGDDGIGRTDGAMISAPLVAVRRPAH
jgi:hypothetical protein